MERQGRHTDRRRGPLARLGELRGFAIVDGDPDIRGWGVKLTDGRKIGAVDDLIVDTEAFVVCYAKVRAELAGGRAGDYRYLLVPIPALHVDVLARTVFLDRPPAAGSETLRPHHRRAGDAADRGSLFCGMPPRASPTDAPR